MTIYQKAIKVRKTCEVQKDCRECPYYGKCKTSNIFWWLISIVFEKYL